MSRFVNAMLVTFMNGFVLLTILGYFLGPQADGGPLGFGLDTARASWGPASADGSVLLLEVPFRNTGKEPVRATQAHVELLAGDVRLAGGDVPVAATAQPGETERLRIPLRLDGGFPARFWQLYAAGGESVRLHAAGTVELARGGAGGAKESLPFTWSAVWKGEFASGLAGAKPPCDAEQAVCVESLKLTWQADGPDLAVTLRNQGDAPVTVGAAQASLALGAATLAQGDGESALRLAPHGAATLRVPTTFQPGGLADWWAGHVLRCEQSPASLTLGLALQDEAGGAAQPQLFVPLPPFETHLACGR